MLYWNVLQHFEGEKVGIKIPVRSFSDFNRSLILVCCYTHSCDVESFEVKEVSERPGENRSFAICKK